MSSDELTQITSTDIRLKPEIARHLVSGSGIRTDVDTDVSTGVGPMLGPNLVIGESGADWARGIAAARRQGPNLALLTQWAGELSAHFAGRVSARMAKREAFTSIVIVCNEDESFEAIAARRKFIVCCARMLPQGCRCTMTLLCAVVPGGLPEATLFPHWARHLGQLAERSRLTFHLESSGVAA